MTRRSRAEALWGLRSQLQAAIKEAWGSSLPAGITAMKLVYQDTDGDLLLLQPSEPWPGIVSSARRVIVTCH